MKYRQIAKAARPHEGEVVELRIGLGSMHAQAPAYSEAGEEAEAGAETEVTIIRSSKQ